MSGRKVGLVLLAWLVWTTGVQVTAVHAECMDCHGESSMATVDEQGNEKSLFVNADIFMETIHGFYECTDCHADLAGMEDGHGAPVEKVQCGNCHFEAMEEYEASIHGQLLSKGNTFVADCSSCHGVHNIFPSYDERSSVHKSKLSYTCASCHENRALQDARVLANTDQVTQFHEGIHGKALANDPENGAPSCNNCHGAHNIQNAANPTSPIHSLNVSETCGQCHTEVMDVYKNSIHGKLEDSGDQRAPVCIDCHESHNILSPETHVFKQFSDEKCGVCHEELMVEYHETFHGKAIRLGSDNVAACYDCHGYHDILGVTDSGSPVHPDNREAMCQSCHENANANFAEYITHANYMDKDNDPQLFYTFVFMTALLVGVFLFFGTHTALWLTRSVILFLQDSKKCHEAKKAVQGGPLIVGRFSKLQRTMHIIMIICFLTLVLTGLPLKFYAAEWAGFVMSLLGGVAAAGIIHRIAAVLLIGIFLLHIVRMAFFVAAHCKKATAKEGSKGTLHELWNFMVGPDSMVPTWRDVQQFVAHNRWFFGTGEKPRFDRWTYWEKFDYLAVFWGVVIIGGSGLILWFPEFFTLFLPGWIINVALIIHSDEALLAAGFIFTIHFFNSHFRIEKFPMDIAIFSGRISEMEMEEERPAWFDRLNKEGKLKSLQLKEPGEEKLRAYKIFGFCAVVIGNLLTIGIIVGLFVTWFSH
jgi:cytochrome b subunit of formate dehydrogenase